MKYGGVNRLVAGGRFRVPALVIGLAVLGAAGSVHAQSKTYSYETNPVRLGSKALDEGRLAEAKAQFEEAIANQWEVAQARAGLADTYVRMGNPGEAEPLYRASIAAQPTAEGHAGLGILLVQLGRVDEAKQEIDKALGMKGDLWEAQFGKALIAIEEKQYDEARKLLEKGKKKKQGLKDGEDKYHFGMGKLLFAQGDLAGAETEALLAMTMNTTTPAFTTLVADIYVQRGVPALAIQTYQKVLAQPGATPTAPFMHQLGTLFEKIQEPNEALRHYQEAVKADSMYAPALRDMARLYTLANVYDKATVAYSRYVQIVPDDLESLVGFTRAALETRQYKSAHDAAKRAFAMDSTRTDIRLLFARSAYQDHDKERATQLYASVTDSTLFEPVDYIRLGQIAYEAKRFDEARAKLYEGTTRDSTAVEGFFTLGILEMQQGNPEAAVAALRKTVELAPTFSPGPLNLGIALLQAKQAEEGIAALRQAQTLAPENPQVLISLAQALVSADSVTAAIAEYRRAIDLEPTNGKALRGLGFCQLKRQSYGEAVTALKDATVADPQSADGWAMLGQAYLGLNDVLRAKQAAAKALAINPSHPTAKSVADIVARQG